MVKKRHNHALGKGLGALIGKKKILDRDDEENSGQEKTTRNMEFYGSLLKKYIEGGGKDPLLEQMLSDTREHLGIDREEHLRLLNTLKKREKAHKHKPDDKWKNVQKDIRKELTQLFEDFRKDGGPERSNEKKLPLKKEKVKDEDVIIEPGAIALPESKAERDQQISKGKRMRMRRVKITKPRPEKIQDENISNKRNMIEWEEDETPSEPIEMPPSESEKDIRETGSVKSEQLGVIVDEGKEGKDVEILAATDTRDKGPGEILSEAEQGSEIGEITGMEPEDHIKKEEEKEFLEDSHISLRLLMDSGKFDEAVEMAERMLQESPDDTSLLNEMGVLLFQKGDREGARDCYRRALEINPDQTETSINYSILLAGTGELDRSLELLDGVIEKDPYNDEAWNNKAVVLTNAGRYREALRCLDEALRINEESPETWLNSAIVLEKMKEYGPACECYRNVKKYDPENRIAEEGFNYCRQLIR
jgi:Flp pilus assembly protein TadD